MEQKTETRGKRTGKMVAPARGRAAANGEHQNGTPNRIGVPWEVVATGPKAAMAWLKVATAHRLTTVAAAAQRC